MKAVIYETVKTMRVDFWGFSECHRDLFKCFCFSYGIWLCCLKVSSVFQLSLRMNCTIISELQVEL